MAAEVREVRFLENCFIASHVLLTDCRHLSDDRTRMVEAGKDLAGEGCRRVKLPFLRPIFVTARAVSECKNDTAV